MALPVRAAFAYRKKKDRREYVRVALRRADDGEIEAVKHPQDVITSYSIHYTKLYDRPVAEPLSAPIGLPLTCSTNSRE